jgi:hypothetical protein
MWTQNKTGYTYRRDMEAESEPPNADICPSCGETLEVGSWPFCKGGHGKGTNNVVDDTIIGGEINENVAHHPVTFYSKSEKRRYLKEHNLQEFIRHTPRPDDRKPDTSRWV